MKFSGYINRASILRLKCEKEVDLMFKFVADRQELVEDKKSMFGIYAPNVKLLAISPGLKTTFKHFIVKVEELIPNLSKRAKRTALSDPESSSKSKANTIRSTSGESLSKEVKLTTVKDLEQRLLKWISKEVVKRNKDVSEEEQRKSFKLKATGSNSFLFTCLQSNCREPCVLRYADKSSSVNMYNAHRHITQSCWLRPNKKPIFRHLWQAIFSKPKRNAKTTSRHPVSLCLNIPTTAILPS